MTINRRNWLKAAGLLGATAGAGALGNLLLPGAPARAADYKALVCIFLYGGNDGLNTIVPTDATRYGQYSAVRKTLALPQGSLLGLGSSGYGLHPSLSGADARPGARARLAPVFNVGPLYQPITKAQFRAAPDSSDLVPDSLFSHSDQQLLWESSSTDSLTRTGWGGRAAEALGTANPVISVGGNGRFGLSSLSAPLVLPDPGATFGAYELGTDSWRLSYAPLVARAAALRGIYAEAQDNDLADVYASMQRDAFAVSDRLAALIKVKPGQAGSVAAIDNAFAPLISQWRRRRWPAAPAVPDRQADRRQRDGAGQPADLLRAARRLRHPRQPDRRQRDHRHPCHAAQGGGRRARLLLRGDEGAGPVRRGDRVHAERLRPHLHAEQQQRHRPRLGQQPPGHRRRREAAAHLRHLPDAGARRPDDVGVDSWELQGRWIPTSSVDQYAATLLSWFGADAGQLDTVLPNLGNFGSARTLGFL